MSGCDRPGADARLPPQRTYPMKYHPSVLLGFCVVAATSAFAATVPYTDSFQSSSTAGWTPGGSIAGSTTWEIANTGGSNAYQATTGNTAGNFTSVVQLTNVNAALGNFTMTSTFKVTDGTVAQFIGLAAFSNNITPGVGSNYLADIDAAGNMRILSQNDTSGFSSTTADFGPSLQLNTNYTMSLSGVYSGSTLNLTFTVTNGTLTQSVTATDLTPLTGQYFGYRLNNGTANDPMQVQFANFDVATSAIPEPATATALLGLGALGAVVVARRRRRTV